MTDTETRILAALNRLYDLETWDTGDVSRYIKTLEAIKAHDLDSLDLDAMADEQAALFDALQSEASRGPLTWPMAELAASVLGGQPITYTH